MFSLLGWSGLGVGISLFLCPSCYLWHLCSVVACYTSRPAWLSVSQRSPKAVMLRSGGEEAISSIDCLKYLHNHATGAQQNRGLPGEAEKLE